MEAGFGVTVGEVAKGTERYALSVGAAGASSFRVPETTWGLHGFTCSGVGRCSFRGTRLTKVHIRISCGYTEIERSR